MRIPADRDPGSRATWRAAACLAAAFLVLPACASAPEAGLTGPTDTDRETTQLLGVARAAGRRWRTEAAVRRTLRERLLRLDAAAGTALATRELLQLLEASGLTVVGNEPGEPVDGRYIRAHPRRLEAVGPLAGISGFLHGLAKRRPRFRLTRFSVTPYSGQDGNFELEVRIDLLERLTLPPLTESPPVLDSAPKSSREGIATLRAHILRVGRAVDEGRKEGKKLREAMDLAAAGDLDPAPLVALARQAKGLSLRLIHAEGERALLRADAPSDDEIEAFMVKADAWRGLAKGSLSDVRREQVGEGGRWVSVFSFDASLAP